MAVNYQNGKNLEMTKTLCSKCGKWGIDIIGDQEFDCEYCLNDNQEEEFDYTHR